VISKVFYQSKQSQWNINLHPMSTMLKKITSGDIFNFLSVEDLYLFIICRLFQEKGLPEHFLEFEVVFISFLFTQ